MPFGALNRPSIGLGLLHAALSLQGVPTKSLYFTLPFARLMGQSLYQRVADGYPEPTWLLGEWIFTGALFDDDAAERDGYLKEMSRCAPAAYRKLFASADGSPADVAAPESFYSLILSVREQVNGFLDTCVEQVDSYRPPIVGLTSVFQQQTASLSLARRIKARRPETFIVLGGANCEGAMGAEVMRQFPFVDAVVSGEGDLVFPELVRRILDGKSVTGLQGVYTQHDVKTSFTPACHPNAPLVTNMDALPFPNYDDFFQQTKSLGGQDRDTLCLLFESSRGCWWGERNHCTFCGLNGATMTYRSKSPLRALEELTYLTDKYTKLPIEVVDNILDLKYFNDFIPELAARQLDLELFYEVKANLKKDQVRALRDAGVTTIQPGIESLSDQVLTLMRKGVSRLQNIQLLKWCKEFGVTPNWNFIWGFPGEDPAEYRNMAELIPLLTHLAPPSMGGPLRLDRFSPNFVCADQLGFADIAPCPAYHHIYPFDPAAVANLAYYFVYRYREPQDVERYTRPLAEQIAIWSEVHENSELFYQDMGAYLLVCDLRPVAKARTMVLSGEQKYLYTVCDSAHTIDSLKRLLGRHLGRTVVAGEIEQWLHPLEVAGLMLRDNNTYLSLAVPSGEYAPRRSVLERSFGR